MRIRTPVLPAGAASLAVLLLSGSMAPVSSAPEATETIKYCEEISEKLGQYSNKDDLFTDLNLKAKRKALTQLLQKELEQFQPQVQTQEVFIDTLLHLVEHQEPKQTSEGLLTPCVVLEDAYVAEQHRQRFQPVEVGRACSPDDKLLAKQAEQMREAFVSRFFSKQGSDQKPSSIAELLVDPEKIGKKFGKDLEKLVREQNVPADPNAMEGTTCASLQIYPIELYALSVPYRQAAAEKDKDKAAFSEQELKQLADQYARWHGVDTQLFRALIEQESNWRMEAVSHKGAVGLAQLMPATAREECGLGRHELSNPAENLACAAHYLAKNLNRFDNNVKLALCAYNAGPGTVMKGKCQNYTETVQYMRKVMSKANSVGS